MMFFRKKFVIIFDDQSSHWQSDPEMNMMAVTEIAQYMQRLCRMRGYAFVREVYERFGLPITKDSIVAGWYEPQCHPMFMFTEDKEHGVIKIEFEAEEDIRDYF